MDRRSEHRYSVCESVVLFSLDALDGGGLATLLDISRSGFRIVSGIYLRPGAEVLTTFHSVAIFGLVRHCEKVGDDCFMAGVEITKVASALDEPTTPQSLGMLEIHINRPSVADKHESANIVQAAR